MKKTWIILTSCVALTAIISIQLGCKKHDPIYPDVCFENEVLPIFVNNCANGSHCHGNNSNAAGYNFTNYENIVSKGIKPGNSGASKVYKSLNGGGEEPMPPSGSLSDYQKDLISSWINLGAENTSNCSSDTLCDTTAVSYTGTIKSILDNNCNGCHSSSNPILSDYISVKNYLDASKTVFIEAIFYTGLHPMPPSYQLSDCQKNQTRSWINGGYPNN